MGHPVMYFEVAGKDGAALTDFYANLFAWDVAVDQDTGYAFVDGVTPGVGGGIATTSDGSRGHVTVYVGTPDVTATLDKAGSLGGSTVMPRTVVSEHITVGLLADPEGHLIGLVEQRG